MNASNNTKKFLSKARACISNVCRKTADVTSIMIRKVAAESSEDFNDTANAVIYLIGATTISIGASYLYVKTQGKILEFVCKKTDEAVDSFSKWLNHID